MKVSVRFQLYSRPNADGACPILLRVSYAGLRVDVRSGCVIEPEKWDKALGCVRSGVKNCFRQTSGEINRRLLELSTLAEEVACNFEREANRAPNAEEFKNAFDVAAGRKEENGGASFFDVFDQFMREAGASWANTTAAKFRSLRAHLYAYNNKLSLSNLTKYDLEGFTKSLQTAGQMNSSVSKYLSFLRWFLRWARTNGYYSGELHQQYKPRLKGAEGKEIIFLTWDELMSFLNYDFGGNRATLGLARDVFCFCCFTGLRYSDVSKLRRADIKENGGKPYISVYTQKTNDSLQIELNKYALLILDTYKGVKFTRGLALPPISNAGFNRLLKEAAKAAEIVEPCRRVYFIRNERHEEIHPKWELLTTHCGRRTFVVNALRLGIPAPVIMEWTGHKDYKAMKPYIKIVDELKAENMEKFNTFESP